MNPSTYFDQDWVKAMRLEVPKAEAKARLSPAQIALLQDKHLFQLLIPASIGGKEYDLPELMRAEEAAAWVDGSVGWVVALAGGAGFFAGFVDELTAKALFQKEDICVAGTGFPAGTAAPVEGGYLVNGHWKYASGAPHAKLYTANCKIGEEIRAMIFLPDQVELADGWKSVGLRATASQDMIIHNAFVPAERSFSLDKSFPHAQGPLYTYPFHQQAEALLSITLMGMGMRFLDLFEERIIPRYRSPNPIKVLYEEVRSSVEKARKHLYEAVEHSWEPYKRGAKATDEQMKAVGEAARAASRIAREASDRLYPYGGMEMMQVDSDINRVWRDIHTASQHALLAPNPLFLLPLIK
jgi:alkylation response protein AidB-like acyl-CoA dehydrogenase